MPEETNLSSFPQLLFPSSSKDPFSYCKSSLGEDFLPHFQKPGAYSSTTFPPHRRRKVHIQIILLFCTSFLVGFFLHRTEVKNLSFSGLSRALIFPKKDWWDNPSLLSDEDRLFQKSVLYTKPHKTGSETFKGNLIHISEYYNLTCDEGKDRKILPRSKRRLMKVDVMTRHQKYKKGKTERQLKGWKEGLIEIRKDVKLKRGMRRLVSVVTVRNPIDRLFSHYFSQRRFKNFTPKRGNIGFGDLSEEEEIDDFKEWLDRYPSNQQVRYLMRNKGNGSLEGNEDMLDRVNRIVDMYQHIITVERWRASLCLFGFREKIMPFLLHTEVSNKNGNKAKRFSVEKAMLDDELYSKVLVKIKYDFILYNKLVKKYFNAHDSLDETQKLSLQRYCTAVDKT